MSPAATLASATRPDSWDLPLFLHILGAMVSVGALSLSVLSLAGAWRSGSEALTRLGYRALLWGAVPGYVVLRGAAQWIANKEGLEDSDVTWINMGFSVTDAGLLLLIVSTVLAGLAMRRSARGEGPAVSARVATVLAAILLLAYLVTVWAMTAKPT
jgi:hypothetical protein